MTMAVSPQLRGRYKARPELEELLAERLGAHHRRAVAKVKGFWDGMKG